MQAAPRIVHAKFFEGRVADDGVLLPIHGEIAIVLHARAGSRVLSEHLILRSGLHPGNQRRGNADTHEGSVLIAPALVETRGPQTGFFGDGKIAANGVQAYEGRGQRSDAFANHRTVDGVHGLTWRATHGYRKLRARARI